MTQPYFAMHKGQDGEHRHIVSLGKDHPVNYVMGSDNQVFRCGRNNHLYLVTDAEHAQKPWIKSGMHQGIKDYYLSRARSSTESKRRNNKFSAYGVN